MVKICQDSRLAISSFHGQYEYPPIFGYFFLMLKETQVLLHNPKCALVIKLSMFFDGEIHIFSGEIRSIDGTRKTRCVPLFDGKIPDVGCLQFLFWCLKPQCFSINMFVHEIPILAVEIC